MRIRTALLAVPAAIALPLAVAPAASADAGGDRVFMAELNEQNDSGASGTATLTLDGNMLTVKINSDGLVPGAPHAQHIHFGPQDTNDPAECPPASADDNGDDIVSTPEGQPFYGAVQVSLTTRGATGMDSALAVKRFPVANEDGEVHYERTFRVSDEVVKNLDNASIVQHGIDTNDNEKYDNSAGPSDIGEDLPLEATAPANCGGLRKVPAGGVDAGAGSTQGVERVELLTLGGAALVGSAALGVTMRRRREQS